MLTTKEAAKIISVEPATIRKYIREGLGKDQEKLKAIQIMHGKRMEYRICTSDLEYYKKKYLTINQNERDFISSKTNTCI